MLALPGASRPAFGCGTGIWLHEMHPVTLIKPSPEASSPHGLPWLQTGPCACLGTSESGRGSRKGCSSSSAHAGGSIAPAGARSGGLAAQGAAHCFHVWLWYLKQVVLSKTYELRCYRKCGVGRNIKHLLSFKEDTWQSSPRLSLLKP